MYELTSKAIMSEPINMKKTLFQPEDSITPANNGPTAAPVNKKIKCIHFTSDTEILKPKICSFKSNIEENSLKNNNNHHEKISL